MKKIVITVIITVSIMILLTACGNNEKKIGSKDDKNEMIETSTELEYGKVTEVTGNEISLKMGKNPEDEKQEEEGEFAGGGAVAAMPAQEVDNSQIELEYTGEQFKFNVQTGIEILNQGKKSSLTSIKKGTILGIERDKNNDVKKIVIVG